LISDRYAEEDFMRTAACVLAAMMVLAAVPVAADDGGSVEGVWATDPDNEDGQAHVEVFEKDGKYYGKLIWLEEPIYPDDDEGGMAGQTKVDRENPDESLRARPILGLEIMQDFEYVGDGKYKKGTIYAPDEGKTYKCKLTLDENGDLKVRGYIGVSLIGRTEVWTRVDDS
jgi:uncharacterized protein (DUF2147 family)